MLVTINENDWLYRSTGSLLIERLSDFMKLKNLVPVTLEWAMQEEIFQYIGKYLDPETEMDSEQISGGPVTIESEYEEALAAPYVVELAKKAEAEGCDGIFINCFGDPGVRATRECVDIPVFGGFEPAVHIALGLGDWIGIVTVLKNVMPLIRGNLAKAHLEGRVISVSSVDIPVADLESHEKLCTALIKECIRVIEENGVEVIVLGCTGMIDVTETIKAKLFEKGYDIPVIEAASAALMMVELYAKMGLKQSRLTYMMPKK